MKKGLYSRERYVAPRSVHLVFVIINIIIVLLPFQLTLLYSLRFPLPPSLPPPNSSFSFLTAPPTGVGGSWSPPLGSILNFMKSFSRCEASRSLLSMVGVGIEEEASGDVGVSLGLGGDHNIAFFNDKSGITDNSSSKTPSPSSSPGPSPGGFFGGRRASGRGEGEVVEGGAHLIAGEDYVVVAVPAHAAAHGGGRAVGRAPGPEPFVSLHLRQHVGRGFFFFFLFFQRSSVN
jgi:hypothetical protein